jgi:hypothetical protein
MIIDESMLSIVTHLNDDTIEFAVQRIQKACSRFMKMTRIFHNDTFAQMVFWWGQLS